jgi:hypothetical protein
MKSYQIAASLLVASTSFACSLGGPSVEHVSYLSASANNTAEPPGEIGVCDLAPFGDVVLVRMESSTYVPRPDDCSGPYALNAYEHTGRVEVVLASDGTDYSDAVEFVSTNIDVAPALDMSTLWMVTLHEVNGVKFARTALLVREDRGGDYTGSGPVNLPTSVAELQQLMSATKADIANACPDAPQVSQKDLEDHYFKPHPNHCSGN